MSREIRRFCFIFWASFSSFATLLVMSMGQKENILSSRAYLTTGITEFASFMDVKSHEVEWLTDLVLTLANYQEEGLQLFPVVFIARDLSLILNKLDGKDAIILGSGSNESQTVRTAFKQCAPLAEERQWAFFIEAKSESLVYGVFRVEESPLKPTAFERLRRLNDSSARLIGLTRLGGNFVELRTSSDRHLYIDLSGAGGESYRPPRLIREFTEVISREVADDLKPMLRAFYYQVGVDLLHSSHGALIAVVSAESGSLASPLSDGVFLQPRIRVIDGISEYLGSLGSDAMQRLKSWSLLLRKMSSMDGITVLDTSGSILGYNFFIPGAVLESRTGHPWGGARRRAYDVLSSHLAKGLEGILYRSQDGFAEFRSASNRTRAQVSSHTS